MENKIPQGISENELNDLLNRAFSDLDFEQPANKKMLDAVSAYTFNRAGFLGHGITYTYKQILLAITLVTGLSVAITFLLNKNESPGEPQRQEISVVPDDPISISKASLHESKGIVASTSNKKPIGPKQKVIIISSESQQQPERRASQRGLTNDTVVIEEKNLVTKQKDEYIFPVLTAKEIKANEKEKRRLIKIATRVTRDKRDDIARIPASPDGAIASFYIASGEVTNNEYRTFLFDLLINERKEEFLKAKPEQALWKKAEGLTVFDTLEKVYFSDKKYNFFPVVNITAEGAEMYCRWLEEGVNAARLNDDKIPKLEIRLPYENEWMYAARSGSSNPVYPWPLESIQNGVNYFMANFCIQKLKDQLKTPIYYPHTKRPRDLSNYTVAGMMLHKPGIATIDVWSFNPNTFGLYGVSGNASEMVYADNSKRIKTKGGNWASDFEHLKLNSEDEFEGRIGPSPKIGFRICAIVK